MQPKSFSASAIKVAALCMARYVAENYHYGERMQNEAAGLGTAVHGALEAFVKAVFLEKTHPYDLKFLIGLFEVSYMGIFKKLDKDSVNYRDGVSMLTRWFERDDIRSQERTVISAEQKTSFPVRVKGYPETPFNYIWDRFDQMSQPGEYTVVDYKTNRWALNHNDLKSNPQARAYGLAGQIAHPNATRIWVEFDFLRHEGGPVGVVFTREDNIATWEDFKKVFKRIWDTDEDNAPETLNNECNFCVRRNSCAALISNANVGGIFGLTLDQQIDRRAQIEAQLRGLSAALQEIDDQLMTYSVENDLFELETEHTKFEIGLAPSKRKVNVDRAQAVLTDEQFRKYGSASITVGAVEELLKSDELTDEQKRQLQFAIEKPPSNTPKIKTKIKSTI